MKRAASIFFPTCLILISCKTRNLNNISDAQTQSVTSECTDHIAAFNSKISEAKGQLKDAADYASQISNLLTTITSDLLKVRDGFSQMRSDASYIAWHIGYANSASANLNSVWVAASGMYTNASKLTYSLDKSLLESAEFTCDSSEKKAAITNFKHQFFDCPGYAAQAALQADYVGKGSEYTNQQLNYVTRPLSRAQGVEGVDERNASLTEAQNALGAVTTARINLASELSKTTTILSQIGNICLASLK